jgi:hypothetical protein
MLIKFLSTLLEGFLRIERNIFMYGAILQF